MKLVGIDTRVEDGMSVLSGPRAGFVMRAWLFSHLSTIDKAAQGRQSRGAVYRARVKRCHDEIERVLAKSVVAFAASAEDPDALLGWACGDGRERVHYCYTKDALRRIGVARLLVPLVAPSARLYTFPARPAITLVATRYGLQYEPERMTDDHGEREQRQA